MNFAVINRQTKKVENIIGAEPSVMGELSNGLEADIMNCDGIPLFMDDDYNPANGKFYRDGSEVTRIPPVAQQIQQAVDRYTLELIRGGIL